MSARLESTVISGFERRRRLVLGLPAGDLNQPVGHFIPLVVRICLLLKEDGTVEVYASVESYEQQFD